MTKVLRLFLLITIACIVAASCTKQNTPEAMPVKPLLDRSEDYFANLRNYKKSDHEVFFAWIGGTGEGSPDFPGVMDQIPDSLDIVSLWGGIPKIGSYSFNKLLSLQQDKGMKFVMVVFDNSGFLNSYSDTTNFAAKYDRGDSLLQIGFGKIAKNISDTIKKYQLDGIDFDHEPNFCGCDWGVLKDNRKYGLFIQAMSKYVGPLSGTEKLFIVDGEYNMSADAGKCLSYIATQAYSTTTPSSLNSRFNTAPPGFPPGRFIVTENFESLWATGGAGYKDPLRGTIPSLLGMAYWEPPQGRKGGAGAYHAEYDYASSPDYRWVRQAIQIMNPAAK